MTSLLSKQMTSIRASSSLLSSLSMASYESITSSRYETITTSAWCEHKGRLKPPLARGAERRPHKHQATLQQEGDASEQSSSLPPTRPELVDRYLSLVTPKEKRKDAMQDIIREFQRFPGDTGSSEVQAALLTSKIAALAEHLKVHRKDYSSRRGLMAMLNTRRQLLQYLRRTSFDRYAVVLGKLGLKDAIGKKYDRLSSRYHD